MSERACRTEEILFHYRVGYWCLVYNTINAARPATPARPLIATIAAAPVAEWVAALAADDALATTDEALLAPFPVADDSTLLADERTLDAEDLADLRALDAEDLAEALAPVTEVKIVVEPVVLPAEPVRALVVTADNEPFPAPPTAVKIVVLPVVLPDGPVKAEVVTAEDEAPAPPTTVKIVVLPVVLPAELVRADVVTAEDEPPAPAAGVPVRASTAVAVLAEALPRTGNRISGELEQLGQE